MDKQNVVIEEDFPPVTPRSQIKLRSFMYRQEGEEYIVVCSEPSIIISLPLIGIETMRLFEQGLSVGEVSLRLTNGEEEGYDITDFVQSLIECGLIAEIDGQTVDVQVDEEEKNEKRDLFSWIQANRVRWLFSTPVLLLDLTIFVASALLLWRYPAFLPQSKDFFFHPWYTLNMLVLVATAMLLIFLHELGHVCAAKAMGVNSRLSIGRRLFSIVAQCQIDNLWQLPRRQRIIIYLAGIITNLWFFFVSLLLIIWQGPTLPTLLYSWFKLVIIFEWSSTAWQFQFYMKTDFYFLISDVFQARNLMDDAKKVLSNLATWLLPWRHGRQIYHDLGYLPARERGFVKVYALFYLLGVGYAVLLFFIYVLPFMITTVGGAINSLFQGTAAGLGHLADAFVALAFYNINFGLLGWFWWREHLSQQWIKVWARVFKQQHPEKASLHNKMN